MLSIDDDDDDDDDKNVFSRITHYFKFFRKN
jgi:hypothetical protein